jgi:argininosuccinate lyase
MWDEDIRGSLAWARQIERAGIITAAELVELTAGLEAVRAEFAAGNFAALPADEDIHSAVERRLGEIAGAVAGKLHTGRSRNDQVATDVRLWALGAIGRADAALRELQAALLAQAEASGEALMPGYTHLQRAQPILLAHWLLSHFWPLERDRARLADCAKRTSTLPLGSAALAGTPLRIDRDALAADLGIAAVSPNSLDAVSDRDFVAEFLFCAALDPERLTLAFGPPERAIVVLRDGAPASYAEREAAALFREDPVFIRLDLGLGDAEATVWTCDFSKDYVEINAHYTT